MRVRVFREKYPRATLFGPERWWDVRVTPWQPVASFSNRIDALNWAQLAALSIGRNTKETL